MLQINLLCAVNFAQGRTVILKVDSCIGRLSGLTRGRAVEEPIGGS
jgi:hypothetical protein